MGIAFDGLRMQMGRLFLLLTLARITATSDDKPEDDDRTQNNRPRIVGGLPVDIAELPFLVSIRKRYSENHKTGSGHFCGGSLISQRVVLTAAHCCYEHFSFVLRPLDYFLVVMGSTFLQRSSDDERAFGCQDIKVHCLYAPRTLSYDIALMLIDGEVPLGSLMKPIAINDQKEVAVGIMCQVSGWGVLNDGSDDPSNELQSAHVPILDNKICIKPYPELKMRSQICAGYMEGNIDACFGDSGGPLKCGNVLVGIVSYGEGCAQKNYPGVYQNIYHLSEWIKDQNTTFNYSHHARSYNNKKNACSLVAVERYCLCLALFTIFFFSPY